MSRSFPIAYSEEFTFGGGDETKPFLSVDLSCRPNDSVMADDPNPNAGGAGRSRSRFCPQWPDSNRFLENRRIRFCGKDSARRKNRGRWPERNLSRLPCRPRPLQRKRKA